MKIYIYIFENIYLNLYIYIRRYMYIYIHPSVHLSIHLSIDLSIYLPIFLSLYISIYTYRYRDMFIHIFILIFIFNGMLLITCTSCSLKHIEKGGPKTNERFNWQKANINQLKNTSFDRYCLIISIKMCVKMLYMWSEFWGNLMVTKKSYMVVHLMC